MPKNTKIYKSRRVAAKHGLTITVQNDYYLEQLSNEKCRMKDRNGTYCQFYENGNKYSEGYYVNGKEDGLFTIFYDDGKPSFEGCYVNGKLDKSTCVVYSYYD